MTDKYILKGKIPVIEPSLLEWAKWYEAADRTVKETRVGDAKVSTVFLGLDRQFGDGPPLLFQTMIFDGDRDGEAYRYSTWEEAAVGHDRVASALSDEICEGAG
jgi:hypothetical protein